MILCLSDPEWSLAPQRSLQELRQNALVGWLPARKGGIKEKNGNY